jgi:predicted CDP-diglyceride synthetase/phosphatidate cytidylyltransferase
MAYLLVHLLLLANAWWLIVPCVAIGYWVGKWNVCRAMMLSIAVGIAATTFLLYSRKDTVSPIFGGSYFSVPGHYYGVVVGTALIASVVFGFWLQLRHRQRK